ncbi:MAG: mannonate dehydratase [Pseudothermotoga sp.]|uniref:mannonate dehydratase n=1 Tax=Pseudothermotoga sp. TaxID=2033661 RepID=UPI0019A51FC1|nr:mannonate dehydratase [Pseudothermotoga sp.]
MKIVFRWFGEDDPVKLEHIRQILGVEGVVGALFDVPVGEVWPLEKIMKLKARVESSGLKLEVIESVNVHEDIKLGLPTRKRYIDNYKDTIVNLAKAGIKLITYNFMPVFDWLRTDLRYRLPDGSETMYYDDELVRNITPKQLVAMMKQNAASFVLPGWEWDRLEELEKTLNMYQNMKEEDLLENLLYFLRQIVPVCEQLNVKMALHPDDPPWSVFSLPRIVTCEENIERILTGVDSPANTLALCTGSLGVNTKNDIPGMIRRFGSKKRISFVHLRNFKLIGERKFYESAHPTSCGSLDMLQIVKALHEIGYDGYLRPDHGRTIWDEKTRPGYGLYDRALGVCYILGLWEAVSTMD